MTRSPGRSIPDCDDLTRHAPGSSGGRPLSTARPEIVFRPSLNVRTPMKTIVAALAAASTLAALAAPGIAAAYPHHHHRVCTFHHHHRFCHWR